VVEVLMRNGVETFESCEGGEGHAFHEPTVRFHGSHAEGFRALSIARALALRCRTGLSSAGSILASRANVLASSRSSFRLLSPISRTLRACATITSCPSCASCRLNQGECVPVSSAIRLRGILLNTSSIPFAVVGSSCSKITSPASFKMQ